MTFTTEAERLAARAEWMAYNRAIYHNHYHEGYAEWMFDAAFPPIRPVKMAPQRGWAILDTEGKFLRFMDDWGNGGAGEARQVAEGALRYHPARRIIRVELREVEE